MYTFDIYKNTKELAKIVIDEQNENIGFVNNEDVNLNNILNILTDIPYLTTRTGDKVGSSYVQMKEKITLKDKRFYDVLKSQLSDYDFSPVKKIENKTIKQALDGN